MNHLKHHAMHIAMCAPMFVVVAILLATGTGALVLLSLIGCVLMMWLMMSAMGHGGGQGRAGDTH